MSTRGRKFVFEGKTQVDLFVKQVESADLQKVLGLESVEFEQKMSFLK